MSKFALFKFVLASLCTGLIWGCSNDSGPVDPVPDAGMDASDNDIFAPNISSLKDPVKASYDEAGVLHIECHTARDCFIVQGYFHAKDRFIQMDLTRNQTLGEMSRMSGFLAFDGDVSWRSQLLSRTGEPLEELYFEALSPETQDIFVAYSEGINAWLSDVRQGTNGAVLQDEYRSFPDYGPEDIRDWRPTDSMAQHLNMSLTFSSGRDDLWRGGHLNELGRDSMDDWWATPRLIENNATVPTSMNQSAGPNALVRTAPKSELNREWIEKLKRNEDFLINAIHRDESPSVLYGSPSLTGAGSNTWVVSGDLTANGAPMVATDPHLHTLNPSIWYLNELRSTAEDEPELHIAGAAIPSGPGIVIGHNKHIAWGSATAVMDLGDAYLEDITPDGNAVERGEGRVEIIRKEFEFQGSGNSEPRTATIEVIPDHGVIRAKNPENTRALAFKWVGQEAGDDLEFLPGLWYASNVDEGMNALNKNRIINIAWTIADRDGNIGWNPAGLVPNRPWASEYSPWFPLPGDGSAEWDGWVDIEDMPKLVNPPAGFIVSTNNAFTTEWDDGDPTNGEISPIQAVRFAGFAYRHSRVVKLLQESDQHTVESIRAIMGDNWSRHGELLVPEFLKTADELDDLSTESQAVVEILRDWGYTCPSGLDGFEPTSPLAEPDVVTESAGCSAFHAFIQYITSVAFADEWEELSDRLPWSIWITYQQMLAHLFLNPEVLKLGEEWFDNVQTEGQVETREDAVREALDLTSAWLTQTFESSDPQDWVWGRKHILPIMSLLELSGIDAPQFRGRDIAMDGGWQTVNMADPEWANAVKEPSFTLPRAASIRMIMELGEDRVTGHYELPAGNVHDRSSQFYLNLVDRWLEGRPTQLPFTPDEVEASAQVEFTFTPPSP